MHVSKLKWPFFVYEKQLNFYYKQITERSRVLEPFTTTIHLQMFTNHRFLVETSGRRHDVSVSSRSGDAARARGFKGLRHKGHVCAVRNQLAKQPRWKTWRLVAQGANTISSEPEKSDKQMAQELASTTQQPKTTKRFRCTRSICLAKSVEDVYIIYLQVETHAVSMSIFEWTKRMDNYIKEIESETIWLYIFLKKWCKFDANFGHLHPKAPNRSPTNRVT